MHEGHCICACVIVCVCVCVCFLGVFSSFFRLQFWAFVYVRDLVVLCVHYDGDMICTVTCVPYCVHTYKKVLEIVYIEFKLF